MSSLGAAPANRVADRSLLGESAVPINQAGELRSSRIESLRALAALGVHPLVPFLANMHLVREKNS